MIRKEDVKGIVIIALFYLMIESIGITCPIKFITGISCAGCGMSRAYISLFKGDISMAFYYHPLFILPPILLFSIVFRNRIGSKLFKTIIVVSALLFVAVYVIRMLDMNNSVVVFEINNGLIFKVINCVTGLLDFK